MEEEYIQSLVTGTLHRATKQPTHWSCVCPSEIDWRSHYAFTTLNSQHMRSPPLLPVYRSRWRLHQQNPVTQSRTTASGLKSIIRREKNKQVHMHSESMFVNMYTTAADNIQPFLLQNQKQLISVQRNGICPMVKITLPKNVRLLQPGFLEKIKESVTDDLFQALLTEGGYCAASQEVMHRSTSLRLKNR